ncbi:hypothetical protein D0X99_16670 [Algoriphagus lacus]|uniref:Zinc-finger domain-containing protein n=1 Tax=Algoriphagus lacus TaxID=2056311 RepID=A0A418PNS0_9BACT|nr:hypothetical protein [Algoriphagus lacus]RIW13403.1 hypothetical protein D0X99_16670 [Algoriphagus lacus]
MKNSSHLSDEALQSYLLKEIQDDSLIVEHLEACSKCQKRLEEYQVVIKNVQKIEPEGFTFDVSALVMNTVTVYEKRKSRRQEFAFWGVLILLVLGISFFSLPFLPAVFKLFFSGSGLITLLAIGVGLGVFLFLLTDIIRQNQVKEGKIFKNNLQPMS